jgi:uncharacterized protein
MTLVEIIVLIVSGLLVGFINTLAGGGSIISLSVLMLMGLPAPVANGTNRIAIIVQTLTATTSFRQQKVLDSKKGWILGIPAIVGAVLGAWIAVDISEVILERAMAVIMLIMLVFMIYNPKKILFGRQDLVEKKVSIWQIIIFFFIGAYGGFLHMGVGYFLLAALVLSCGYDLVRANAVKVFIVLMYVVVSFLVFIFNDQVYWKYGLVLTIGNVAGAYVASRLAVQKGVVFVKWVIVTIILVMSGHLFNIYDIKEVIGVVLNSK